MEGPPHFPTWELSRFQDVQRISMRKGLLWARFRATKPRAFRKGGFFSAKGSGALERARSQVTGQRQHASDGTKMQSAWVPSHQHRPSSCRQIAGKKKEEKQKHELFGEALVNSSLQPTSLTPCTYAHPMAERQAMVEAFSTFVLITHLDKIRSSLTFCPQECSISIRSDWCAWSRLKAGSLWCLTQRLFFTSSRVFLKWDTCKWAVPPKHSHTTTILGCKPCS